jgi:uncharacterized membrane protein YesL
VRAFRVFWLSVRDLYEELFVFAGLNLLWWLCALVVVLIPPATAGLMYIANEIVHERRIEWRMFLEGARIYFWRSWQVFIVGAGVAFILLTNVLFYYQATTGVVQYLTILWIYLLIIWLVTQIYVFPFLIQMEQPRVIPIFRNALLLTLSRPLFTVVLMILLALATALGAVFAIVLILAIPGLWALASTRALTVLLEEVRAAQKTTDKDGKAGEGE